MAGTTSQPRMLKTSATTNRSGLLTTPSLSHSRPRADNSDHAPTVNYENTYRMTPKHTFPGIGISDAIKDILEEHLDGKKYDHRESNQRAKYLADLVKQQVKDKCLERYKIVTFVNIGAIGNNQPTMFMSSQCLWNKDFDNYAEYTYRNASLYATVIVYALYAE